MLIVRRGASTLRCLGGVGLSIGSLLLAGCSSLSAASPAPADSTTAAVSVVGVTTYRIGHRQVMPALAGTGLDGRPVSLSAVGRGKIVVLNVWASWCDPCREESPMLARSATALAAEGVQFVGLDEQDRVPAARAFVRSTGSTYPHLVDKDGLLLVKLQMLPQMGIPSTLVIDRHGRVAARVIGAVTASDIHRIIDRLETET
jgi:thiol-disulfide isomerase/thioredoxin